MAATHRTTHRVNWRRIQAGLGYITVAVATVLIANSIWGGHSYRHPAATPPTRVSVEKLDFAVLSPSIVVPTGLAEPERHLITNKWNQNLAVMRPGEVWDWRIPPRMYPLYVDVRGQGAHLVRITADGKPHDLGEQHNTTRLGEDGDLKVATEHKELIFIGLYKFYPVDHSTDPIYVRLTVDPDLKDKDPVFYWRPIKAPAGQTTKEAERE